MRMGDYVIFKVENGIIVYNTRKSFSKGHTHLKSHKMAMTLVDLSSRKKLPISHNGYLLESLIRISDDSNYIEKLRALREVRRNKTKVPCRRNGYG